MASTKKYYSTMKEALETFNLKKFLTWLKKYNPALYKSFSEAPEVVQMGAMCKMICNRTDMLGSETHKKAINWLRDHNMKGRIY